jgi:electron transfer flavoprotein alpha subunit
MRVLTFLEHREREILKPSLAVLSSAVSLEAEEVAGVVIGEGVHELATVAGGFGADRVWVADDPLLRSPLPQPRIDVLASVVTEGGYDTVLFAASVLGADVAAGLSSRLDAGVNWDLLDLTVEDGRLVATRAALGDAIHAKVGWVSEPRIALFRAGALEATEVSGKARVEQASIRLEAHSQRSEMVEEAHEDDTGASIEDAEIIVAGGRGMGGSDGIAMVEELAQALGGAVGATRPMVDAGLMPFSTQVGQTGRAVAPKLYIACGISGAIQHKVGMQRSEAIVAINTDQQAPIFEIADLGVIGDLHEVIPKLTELIQSRS